MRFALHGLVFAVWFLVSCAPHSPRALPTSTRWTLGCTQPAFDPDGPTDAVRVALERCLSRGLVERDANGRIVAAAATRFAWSADSLQLTFQLPAGSTFTDGSPVTSEDFRRALIGGLGREDHSTRAWLLGSIRGVAEVRAGRALPPLGIETPDAHTLVLHLIHPDPHLLEALAQPGVSTPWKVRSGEWAEAVGIGPYRIERAEAARGLVLVSARPVAGVRTRVDTIRTRFVVGAPRIRTLLRQQATDLLWPVPPALLGEGLPAGYRVDQLSAQPARRLMLILRADIPPLHKLPARHALAHALDRRELLAALGANGSSIGAWLPGAPVFDFPSLDQGLVREWLARGRLGGSFHITLAYDADRAGAELARVLQGQWARAGLYVELRAQRGIAASAEPLAAAAAHAQLVVSQAPWAGAAAEVALFVMPLRGPAVGPVRTGWRTREFDAAILPGASASLDPARSQSRFAEERIVLPIADLPWVWAARDSLTAARFDPWVGLDYTVAQEATDSSH